MREEELKRALGTLARLVEQASRDGRDLRSRGETTGVERVTTLVETAKRLGDILYGALSGQAAAGSKNDDNRPSNED